MSRSLAWLFLPSLLSCQPGAMPARDTSVLPAATLPSGGRVQGLPRGEPLPGEDLAARAEAAFAIAASQLGLPQSATDRYAMHRIHALRGGGVVIWRATVDGLPVIDGDLKAVIDADGRLVGGAIGSAAGLSLASAPPSLGAADAIEVVLGRAAGPLREHGEWSVAPDGAHARQVAFAVDGQLRRAWQVEHDAPSGGWLVMIDASDGRELMRASLTSAHDYGVYADDSGDLRPDDSPWEDITPHPTGEPDGLIPLERETSTLVTVEGFNVFGDPWLDAAATSTSGNNANAYADRFSPTGFSDGDVAGAVSAPDMFDWPYDFSASPLIDEDQAQPGITQGFYTVNWLHDHYYASGFDEAAGTAQVSNYGRGGLEGDAMLVELQDASDVPVLNNANMYTPSDGFAPTMQFYIWGPRGVYLASADPARAGQSDPGAPYAVDVAPYGPQEFDVEGTLAEAGTDPTGCQFIDADLDGLIAFLDEGPCDTVTQVGAAQAAGAIGVVIAGRTELIPVLEGADPTLVIPTVSVDMFTRDALRDLMAVEPQVVSLRNFQREGAFDNTVLAHEWGHYLFGRVVGFCGSMECSGLNEGNSDIVALLMELRDGDDRDGTYTVGAYAVQDIRPESAYYGIRRVPYSRDRSKNALSFRNMMNTEPLPTTHPMRYDKDPNSQVHNTGEIWATTVFEAYLALQDAGAARGDSFADVEREMMDILVSGLSLAPNSPTFLELRDALLIAANVVNPEDALLMADVFAGRGMGSCAVGPTEVFTPTTDFVGVVEDTGTTPKVRLSDLVFEVDPGAECDADGRLDAGERALLSVDVKNLSVTPLEGATVRFTADPPVAGLTFPGGDLVAVPTLDGFATTTLNVEVELALKNRPGDIPVVMGTSFAATVEDGACNPGESAATYAWLEGDDVSGGFTFDDFSSDDGSWTRSGDLSGDVWSRQEDPITGQAGWTGAGTGEATDTRLVSPVMSVDGDLVVTLTHAWSFSEFPDVSGDPVYSDGVMLEVSVDGGLWEDIRLWVDPGYPGQIWENAFLNPLAGRSAFVGTNPSYPDFDVLTLDFGAALIGHDVQLAARLGTPVTFVGPDGGSWELDAIDVTGISNLPFPGLVLDGTTPASWYLDGDGDSYGDDATALVSCVPPADYVALGGDCDDTRAGAFPGAQEVCGGADDDCDALVDDADDSVTGQSTWFSDADGDTFGDPASSALACDPAEAWVADDTDCDDQRADVFPGATELPTDGVDQDCDQLELCAVDVDADGYGIGAVDLSADLACAPLPDGDCDDASSATNPGATEVCNDLDDDCDVTVDEGAADAATWFADADSDGFTDALDAVAACDAPEGYAPASDLADCDDGDASSFPGGADIPGDGIDQDCSGEDAVEATTDDSTTPETDGVAGDTDDTDAGDEKAGCGCDSSAGGFPGGLALAGVVGLFARRRRSMASWRAATPWVGSRG